MKKIYLLLILFSVIFTACENGGLNDDNNGNSTEQPGDEIPTDKIVVKPSTIKVGATANDYVVAVYSPCFWRATTEDEWVVIENELGVDGKQSLIFTVKDNLEPTERRGKIIVSNSEEGFSAELTIRQEGIVPKWNIETTSLTFAAQGGSEEVAITANCNYDVIENENWLSVERSENGIKITTEANDTYYERSADVTISNTKCDLLHTIHVVQAASQFQLTVSLMNTRTALGDKTESIYPLYWSEGDRISCNGIVSDIADVSYYPYIATFGFNQIPTPPYSIIYPAQSNEISATKDGCCPVIFPTTQKYIEGTFDVGSAPMYNYTSETNTSLKLLSGVLRLAIRGEETLSHITVTAETGYISGVFDLDCQTGEIYPQEGKAYNQIVYEFKDGLKLNTEATALYIAIPTGEYGWISYSISATNGKSMTVRFNFNGRPIEPGVVREFSEFTFEENNL